MSEWPATINRRYPEAVIFNLDCVVALAEPDAVEALDSTVPLLRRL